VLWTWQHDLKKNKATWTQFWPDGRQKIQSVWNTKPQARDLRRSFFGLVADGLAKQWSAEGALNSSGNFLNGLVMAKEGH
jgi:hypothetical protein